MRAALQSVVSPQAEAAFTGFFGGQPASNVFVLGRRDLGWTGYTAYLTGWDAHAVNAAMDARLRATVFADDRTLSTVHHFQDNMYLPSSSSDDEGVDFMRCPATSEIKVSAIPGVAAAGNRLDCSFRLLLVKNN